MTRKAAAFVIEQHQSAAKLLGQVDLAIAEVETMVYSTYPKASSVTRKMMQLRSRLADARVALEDALCKEHPDKTLVQLNYYAQSRGNGGKHTALAPSVTSVALSFALSCTMCSQPYTTRLRPDGLCEDCVRLPALAL